MTVRLDAKQIQAFQEKILTWYKKNKRDLPWRHTRDPYKILVSEVMSQQTQISRVVPKYLEWMEAFPDIQSLAKASTRDVLFHWSGLGYNRRALYLKKVAELLSKGPKETNGTKETKVSWPEDEKELMKLPGIGKYTARAILCFAFNKQVAVVDTNVRKVILTEFFSSQFWVVGSQTKSLPVVSPSVIKPKDRKQENHPPADGPKTDNREQITEREIEQIAEQLLPKGKAYEWNQALMDYAASELKGNPSLRVKKQKAFLDSDRYFRGLTLRILLEKNKQSFENLLENVLKDSAIDGKRYKNLLIQLEKDKLITRKGKNFMLPEN